MKKKTLLILCSLPLLSYAQETATKADTVITKDVSNPNAFWWVIHSKEGKVKVQGEMLSDKKEGVWREYNETNNMPVKTEEYHNGEKNGATMLFGSNGVITTDETYKNGKLEGQRLTMSTSWRVKEVENYHDGLLNGNKKVYYDDGKVEEDGDWKNNQREGKTSWFFQSGNPSIVYTYSNGVMNGPSITYNEKGNIISRGNYVDSNEDGKWEMNDEDGNPEKTVIYQNGKIIKEIPAKKKATDKKQ